MIKVTEKDIGRKVIYSEGNYKEYGVITSFNEIVVFVRYGTNQTSQSTRREDLQYDMNEEFYEKQIKGLILIMKQREGMVARDYVTEKLNMILNGGIGFHPSIQDQL